MLDEVWMSVGQPAALPPSLALWWGGERGGTLKAPVGAFLSSALPSWRWVIFKTQCVCLCICRSLLPFSTSQSLSH